VGAVFVAFALYLQGGWLLTDAHVVDTGVTPVPTYAKIAVIVNEVVFGIGILACVWFALLRPRIRDGRVSFEGLLFCGFMTVWWQDPLYNYLTTGFTYNAYFLNLGGWSERIPGWGSPNGREFGEPLIWDFGFYAFLSFAGCLLAVWVLKRVKGRWPDLRDGVMWTLYFAFLLVADFVVEFQWVLSGAYAYAGTHDSWTIFPDRYYRFPLYEPILAAMLFIGWTALLFCRKRPRPDGGRARAGAGADRGGSEADAAVPRAGRDAEPDLPGRQQRLGQRLPAPDRPVAGRPAEPLIHDPRHVRRGHHLPVRRHQHLHPARRSGDPRRPER
jgi:hypothetical protein